MFGAWEICALAACYACYRLGKLKGGLETVIILTNNSKELFDMTAEQFRDKLNAVVAKRKAAKVKS